MNIATDWRIAGSQAVLAVHEPRHDARITRIILAIACVVGVTAVQAQQVGDPDGANCTTDTPWMSGIFAATAIDAYVPDPTFHGGLFGLDHFAAANNLDQVGLVTAKLANGDMVVAGLVPDGVGGGTCSDGTKLCSIGLVRYNAAGQRVTWSNPGVHGRDFDNYVVYASGVIHYQYLRDINVRGNYIDVLVDAPNPYYTEPALGRGDVRIETFRDDGSHMSGAVAFGTTGLPAADAPDDTDFYGAQMVQMNGSTMIVAATGYGNAGSFIAVTRLTIRSDGLLVRDATWGIPYGGVDGDYTSRFIRYFAPGSYCGAAICEVTASYAVKPDGSNFADFYVGGSIHVGGSNWDPIALKISSLNGSRKMEFNTTGWSRAAFDDFNSTLDDRVAGLYVYQDEVYMAAQVSRKCLDGIGLAKLDGSTGANYSGFGFGGRVVHGGQGNASVCALNGTVSVPFAISATGGRIGIAGYNSYKNFFGSGYTVDPMLAVVNAGNGSLLGLDSYPVKRADGTRYGDAILFGIYGGPSPTSPFTVSGYGRDASDGNTLSYLSGRLIPVSADRIFASGFGSDDDH